MIKERVTRILQELPSSVTLVLATKKRGVDEIKEAIAAGVKVIGENYVKETEVKFAHLKRSVEWHLIGHLQKNKVRRAVKLFDMIQTLDSLELAQLLDKECERINKVMPVLIEVNSAQEPQKTGVLPGDVEGFIHSVSSLSHLMVKGLMTMGPFVDEPEQVRPFFRQTRQLFNRLTSSYGERLALQYLSMGMSDTYHIALQEGANMVRLGTVIFGERQ